MQTSWRCWWLLELSDLLAGLSLHAAKNGKMILAYNAYNAYNRRSTTNYALVPP